MNRVHLWVELGTLGYEPALPTPKSFPPAEIQCKESFLSGMETKNFSKKTKSDASKANKGIGKGKLQPVGNTSAMHAHCEQR